MSFTVLQNTIEKGVFCFSSLYNDSSQLKHRNCLSACKTVNLLSLLGLTIMRSPLFIPRHLIKRFLISLLAVAVSARRGVPLSRQDRNSATRPNASRKAAFPFFPSPLWQKSVTNSKKMKIFICPEWLQKMLCISLDSSCYLGLLFCSHVHDDTAYITTIFIMKNHKIVDRWCPLVEWNN